jgi:hypothetical protein
MSLHRRFGHATNLCPVFKAMLTSENQMNVRQIAQDGLHSRSSRPPRLHLEPTVPLLQCLPNLSRQKHRLLLRGLRGPFTRLATRRRGSYRARLAGKDSNHSYLARFAGLESKFKVQHLLIPIGVQYLCHNARIA